MRKKIRMRNIIQHNLFWCLFTVPTNIIPRLQEESVQILYDYRTRPRPCGPWNRIPLTSHTAMLRDSLTVHGPESIAPFERSWQKVFLSSGGPKKYTVYYFWRTKSDRRTMHEIRQTKSVQINRWVGQTVASIVQNKPLSEPSFGSLFHTLNHFPETAGINSLSAQTFGHLGLSRSCCNQVIEDRVLNTAPKCNYRPNNWQWMLPKSETTSSLS